MKFENIPLIIIVNITHNNKRTQFFRFKLLLFVSIHFLIQLIFVQFLFLLKNHCLSELFNSSVLYQFYPLSASFKYSLLSYLLFDSLLSLLFVHQLVLV